MSETSPCSESHVTIEVTIILPLSVRLRYVGVLTSHLSRTELHDAIEVSWIYLLVVRKTSVSLIPELLDLISLNLDHLSLLCLVKQKSFLHLVSLVRVTDDFLKTSFLTLKLQQIVLVGAFIVLLLHVT